MEGNHKRGRRWRAVLQWVLAFAVLGFVFRRLATDWPAARAAFHAISWWWLVVSILPGVAYFLLRAHAWGVILRGWHVHTSFRTILRVWMKAEVLRFLPGTIWAVFGRVTQAAALGTSKVIVSMTLLQEAVVMLVASGFVAAMVAIPVRSSLLISETLAWVLIGACVLTAAVVLHPRGGAIIGRLVQRILHREEFSLETLRGERASFPYFCIAWVSFAFFQYMVARAFGFGASLHEMYLFLVAFLVGWILGYVTVFAPSGLGVREAVVVALLGPMIGATEAVVVAALTRIGLLLMEIIILSIVVFTRSTTTQSSQPVIH